MKIKKIRKPRIQIGQLHYQKRSKELRNIAKIKLKTKNAFTK